MNDMRCLLAPYLLLMSPQIGQEAPIGDQLTHQAHWLRSGDTSNHVDNVWVARCDPLHHLNLIHKVLLLLALGCSCKYYHHKHNKYKN